MVQSMSRKRPWLAALLAALATGLGHLYLRRWRRALGWLAASFVVTALFVDPTVAEEFASGDGSLDRLAAVAPMFLVVGLSVLDAYLLARAHNAVPDEPAADSVGAADPAEGSVSCPHCGKDFDPDLEFCHWCTKPVQDVDRDGSDAPDET